MTTDQDGETTVDLLPGEFVYHAMAQGYASIMDQTFLVENQPLTIEVTFAAMMNVTFNISDPDGEPIVDACITIEDEEHEAGQYMIPNFAPGIYEYKVTREFFYDHVGTFEIEDQNLTMDIVLQRDYTATEIIDEALNFKLFPNPTRNLIFVRINKGQGSIQLTLMNYQGQLIDNKQINPIGGETTVEFNLSDYAAGIYYLRVSDDNTTRIEKIIKQ